MDDSTKQKLQELYLVYSKQLPSKVHALEEQWNQLIIQWDENKLKTLHRDAHSLSGSSSTYGYHEIGKLAKKVELLLKELLGKENASSLQQNEISAGLLNLKKGLQEELFSEPQEVETTAAVCENRLVYIVEKDKHFIYQLKEHLKQLNYLPHVMQDLITLEFSVKEKPPTAIIIHTDFLKKAEDQATLKLLKQVAPLQVFCVVPNETLPPRLYAIRSECDAFFQKPVDIPYLGKVLDHKCSYNNKEPYRILIIDDSESLAEYYALILNQAGMDAKAITNPLNLLKELEKFEPNLLLMDIYMPDCTGLELAAILRIDSKYTKIPIIFLSREEDNKKKLLAISLGGDDFLSKPISPQHLISAVISRAKRASILNYYMTTDSLTGLLNHSSILKKLDLELNRVEKNNNYLTFVMIDIDHFKKINDTYGHQVGDMVIKKLASLLFVKIRNQDTVGRYGGEEFSLILPGSTIKESVEICEELRKELASYHFKADHHKFSVTFSAGISYFNGGITPSNLIREADQALYLAKQLGRNQIVVFEKYKHLA